MTKALRYIPFHDGLAKRLQSMFGLNLAPSSMGNWIDLWLQPSCTTRIEDLLSSAPTPHQMTESGVTSFAWCALDAMIFAIITLSAGEQIELESTDPQSGEVLRMTLSPGSVPGSAEQQETVLFCFGVSRASCPSLIQSCCPYFNLFSCRESYDRWCLANDDCLSVALSLSQSWELAEFWAEAMGTPRG